MASFSHDAQASDGSLSATLTEQDAICIYLAKAQRTPRDSTSAELAARYRITMKAVRDIWNLRTWTWKTMPYWTQKDHKLYLHKNLCAKCSQNGVTSLQQACKTCRSPRRRGRPTQTVWADESSIAGDGGPCQHHAPPAEHTEHSDRTEPRAGKEPGNNGLDPMSRPSVSVSRFAPSRGFIFGGPYPSDGSLAAYVYGGREAMPPANLSRQGTRRRLEVDVEAFAMRSFHPMAGIENRWMGCCESYSSIDELQEQAIVSNLAIQRQYHAHLQNFHPYVTTTDHGRVDAMPRQWTCSNDYQQAEQSYDHHNDEGTPDYTAMREPACARSLAGFPGPNDEQEDARWENNVESGFEPRYYQQSEMLFEDPGYLPHDY